MSSKMLLWAVCLLVSFSLPASAVESSKNPTDSDAIIMPAYDFYVEVGDFYFSPETLHVQPGQTVRWENISAVRTHTSTATGGYWDSGDITPGAFYEFMFDSVGSFDYLCTYHPMTMTGLIVVDAPVITPEEVQIIDFAFVPADLTVNLGDSVRWTNYDVAPHTSTSDDGVWDSGILATGESYTYHTDTVGVFDYHCTVHPSMLGTLTVLDTVVSAAYEYTPGDANMPNGGWPPVVIGSDVTYLVNYFRGLGQACNLDGVYASADVNGDCNVIGSDVTRLVNYFRGLGALSHCPDFPPAWETPPMDPPPGWPNCD